MRILVTGGCGFIGSNFLNLMVARYPSIEFGNLDCLTYAANPANLAETDDKSNYRFFRADLSYSDDVCAVLYDFKPDRVVHFAAETHVDRSILGPLQFVKSNIEGTFHLLEGVRELWSGDSDKLFHHVSTDEVYGDLGPTGAFTEETPYAPSSPYSASKASSDHLVRAWHRTYGLPVTISNCSNNYGPYQFPEKLIPLMILRALSEEPLPVYGDGSNVRDWLHVTDHCEAVWTIMQDGKRGHTYNIGGDSERTNNQVVTEILSAITQLTGKDLKRLRSLVSYVTDRPGHDRRYAIDSTKLKTELSWKPAIGFEEGIHQTVKWYLDNDDWTRSVTSGDYHHWIDSQYGGEHV